jgi:hypothetical protein
MSPLAELQLTASVDNNAWITGVASAAKTMFWTPNSTARWTACRQATSSACKGSKTLYPKFLLKPYASRPGSYPVFKIHGFMSLSFQDSRMLKTVQMFHPYIKLISFYKIFISLFIYIIYHLSLFNTYKTLINHIEISLSACLDPLAAPIQIIKCFGFFRYIVFTMHADIVYI